MSRALLRAMGLVVLTVFFQTGSATAARVGGSLFWGVALSGAPITAARLAEVSRETGIRPQVVLFYLQWPTVPYDLSQFPRESLDAIWDFGAIPCLSWEPMSYHGLRETMISYQTILQGRYDPYLKAFARAVRRWHNPLIIRFAHEMNVQRYHWGTIRQAFGPRSPEIYRRMFCHLVDLFRREGADNVLWAFSPNAESIPNPAHDPGAEWNEVFRYYPGTTFVDLLGMDGYNWGTTQNLQKSGWISRWQTFEEIFASLYKALRALAPEKPLLVFETAAARQGGERAAWVRDMLVTLERWQARGLIWFQADKETDWRLTAAADRGALELIRSHLACCPQSWLKELLREGRRNRKRQVSLQ